MHFAAGFLILIALLPNFFPETGVDKNVSSFDTKTAKNLKIRQNIPPFSSDKFNYIIKQEHDFSCGSASLGTLLNYYLNERLSEKQIIRGLLEFGDKEQVKKLRAFSLWDMQQFLNAIGYKSGGYKAEIADIKNKDYWPCLVLINVFNYKHFVVLKGVYQDHVFVADPYIGNSSYTMEKFKKIWDRNIMFIVWADKEKTVSGLKLSKKDLRFIDKDLQQTLMTNKKNITDKTNDYLFESLGLDLNENTGKWQKYKQ